MGGRGSWRRASAVTLGVYSAFLAIVLLAPASGAQSQGASWLGPLATGLGAPARFATQSRLEFLGNALILMPVSALGSVVWPRTTWRDWTAYAFIVAGAVEVTQGLLLPHRSATFADIVANTLGGLGGAAFVTLVRALLAARGRVHSRM